MTEAKGDLYRPEPVESPFVLGLDIETTGTDPAVDLILEVAIVVIDRFTLQIVESFETLIQPGEPLTMMGDYCTKMHTKNGILEEIRAGQGIPLPEAIAKVKEIADRYPKCMLLGRNVGTFDRAFIEAKAPGTLAAMHYRCVDLSSILAFVKFWVPELAKALPPPELGHRSLRDVLGDLSTLRVLVDKFAKAWRAFEMLNAQKMIQA